jgi:hypothetical protein
MKRLIKSLFIFALIAGLLWGLSGSWLKAEASMPAEVDIAAYQGVYDGLLEDLNNRSLQGHVFRDFPKDQSENGRMVIYTVKVTNRLPFSIQMMELSIVPSAKDILAVGGLEETGYEINRGVEVQGFSSAEVHLILITTDEKIERDLKLSGYLFGYPVQRKLR